MPGALPSKLPRSSSLSLGFLARSLRAPLLLRPRGGSPFASARTVSCVQRERTSSAARPYQQQQRARLLNLLDGRLRTYESLSSLD